MFLYSKWLSLDLPTRIKIAEIFGIVKRGSTHVVNDKIQSDGYVIEEVEAILTPETLQKHLGVNETDPSTLWDLFIDKMEGREVEGTQAPATVPEPAIEQNATMSVLPPKEAKQFKKEYKARTKSTVKATVKKKVATVKKALSKVIKKDVKRTTKKK